MNKIIYILIISMLIQSVSAIQSATIIDIPETTDTPLKLTYQNNIYTQFLTHGDNYISEIGIDINNFEGNSTAIRLNYDNNVTILINTVKRTGLSFSCIISCMDVRQIIYYTNSTGANFEINNQTKTWNNILNLKLHVVQKYDASTGNTSIITTNTFIVANNVSAIYFDSNLNLGLPSQNIAINSLSSFDISIIIDNIVDTIETQAQINQLSPISKAIYKFLTLGGFFGENEILLGILTILDIFFWFIIIIISVIFTYPWLIVIWLITFGNLYIAYYASTNYRELLLRGVEYYKFTIEKIYNTLTKIIEIIINIIKAIAQLLPI